VARDSLFGETIVWSGRAKRVTVPFGYKVTAVVSAVVSAITIGYAIVVNASLDVDVGGMVVFAGWCAVIALGAWRGPLIFRANLEYIVTDKHVIWRRGRIRRSIERAQISYAIIRWSPHDATSGDLVLVRAVPTGALRRTLTLTLFEVDAPDRLWALVRGVAPGAPLGNGDRPLAQRLDEGERVLWSAVPLAAAWTVRRIATTVAAALVFATFVDSLARGAPAIARLGRSHVLSPALFALVVVSAALGSLLLFAVSIGMGYAAVIRPIRLVRATRYFVTTSRVLIRRDTEELQLDRTRIAYVIDAPVTAIRREPPLHDVFLVLDGPQARALAASGAFGSGDDALRDNVLRPVFSAIVDADTVAGVLRSRPLDQAA
jgi:hypothetical protein